MYQEYLKKLSLFKYYRCYEKANTRIYRCIPQRNSNRFQRNIYAFQEKFQAIKPFKIWQNKRKPFQRLLNKIIYIDQKNIGFFKRRWQSMFMHIVPLNYQRKIFNKVQNMPEQKFQKGYDNRLRIVIYKTLLYPE